MDHADSGDSKARSHTRLVCRNPGPWWHAPLARMVTHGEATEAWKQRGVFLLLSVC